MAGVDNLIGVCDSVHASSPQMQFSQYWTPNYAVSYKLRGLGILTLIWYTYKYMCLPSYLGAFLQTLVSRSVGDVGAQIQKLGVF